MIGVVGRGLADVAFTDPMKAAFIWSYYRKDFRKLRTESSPTTQPFAEANARGGGAGPTTVSTGWAHCPILGSCFPKNAARRTRWPSTTYANDQLAPAAESNECPLSSRPPNPALIPFALPWPQSRASRTSSTRTVLTWLPAGGKEQLAAAKEFSKYETFIAIHEFSHISQLHGAKYLDSNPQITDKIIAKMELKSPTKRLYQNPRRKPSNTMNPLNREGPQTQALHILTRLVSDWEQKD